MAVEIGQIVAGKITGITHFGAFVSLPENQSGLVHISEVSDGYVKDINDIYAVGDEVSVKVLKMTPDGKINLSIRQANTSEPAPEKPAPERRPKRSFEDKVKQQKATRETLAGQQSKKEFEGSNFDSMMSQFLKDSEDRLASLRRNTEGKRGGRGGRRS